MERQIRIDGTLDPAPKPRPKPRDIMAPHYKRAENPEFARRCRQMEWRLPPATPEETAFRHSHWAARRDKIRARLIACGMTTFGLERWDCCGSECCVEMTADGKNARVRANYCKSRHCEPCAKGSGAKMAGNLRNRLAERPQGRYRFITLTLAHTTAPLGQQVKRLYASFKRLRGGKVWKQSQRGGVLIPEIKWDPSTRQWHPHLHVISEGNFIAQKDLASAWHQVTGDSFIVDVRALTDAKTAVYYLTKYVTKGTSAAVWDDDNASAEWVTATKGLRVGATFGSWRGFALLQSPKDTGEWRKVASITSILQAAWRKEEWALGLLRSLKRNVDNLPEISRAGEVDLDDGIP